jgi:hypothetical protein
MNIDGADLPQAPVPVNMFNYAPAGTLPKVPITCYACSSSFINNPAATDADPIKQAALRDADNWLYRVFFNNKYEMRSAICFRPWSTGRCRTSSSWSSRPTTARMPCPSARRPTDPTARSAIVGPLGGGVV